MDNKFFQRYVFVILAAWLCTSCSYIQHHQQQAQYSQIENRITLSKLDKVIEYTSRTPYHKTYEFEFNQSKEDSYALIFYFSESSFSKSIIKHRKKNNFHRNAVRIDDSKNIMTALNKNLPDADTILWPQVTNHVSENDARDGYHVLQEYIRLKIRDL